MSLIRKISIGENYQSSMNYMVGQSVFAGHIIHDILKKDDGSFDIWIEKNKEAVLWKTINKDVPVIVEYNTNT